jgi:uncharacterized protein
MPNTTDLRMLTAWQSMLTTWDAWLLTFVLVVIVPAVGYLRFRRLQVNSQAARPLRTKLALYARIIGWQWLLVAAMMLVLWRHGLSMADAGEGLGDARLTLAVTAGLLLILGAVTAIIFWRIRRAPPARLAAKVEPLRRILPAFGPEMVAFACVSLNAGVCEELLYRGWLVNLLRAATGSVWIAIVAGAAVFGIAHAYQGAKGMLRTGFVGLQLAYLFVAVDSLVPGQVLHAGVDLVTAFALATAASRVDSVGPGDSATMMRQ